MLPVTQIDTFYNGVTLRHRYTINAAAGGTFMKRRPKECYDLIKNMTAHHNDWDTSAQRGDSSRLITFLSPEIAALTQQITCGGPHHNFECQAVDGFTQEDVYAATGNYIAREIEKAFNERPRGALPSNTVPNPKEDIKVITIQSGITLAGPLVPSPDPFSSYKEPAPASKSNEIPERNPHQPLIPYPSRRPFLRTARALVDLHGEELTLRVADEKLTFNVESTLKYPHKHEDGTINQIDIIDTTCEDHFYEVLNVKKLIHPLSGSLTPSSDPIATSLSPSLTPFGDSDFLLEETDAFVALDDLIPPEINNGIYDSERDIFFEKLLNDDPTKDLPPKEHNNDETKMTKSSIKEPPELELKDLPPHLKYMFLEGTSKLPVIIAKDLKIEEKDQLIKVLKSHKRIIAWKIFDIRGIDPSFYTHKILMEDDFKPVVQHQRRVNTKIHEVIKIEVIKLLDVGLIYPISDSPWVSHVHVEPKKGGRVVTNDNNELIPTRLVTGWHVCIDYQKLNDATRK
nr:reverse transcriptase domain-containing protein [Tanacetum cinerariifolium]